jgi:hypothetical protein
MNRGSGSGVSTSSEIRATIHTATSVLSHGCAANNSALPPSLAPLRRVARRLARLAREADILQGADARASGAVVLLQAPAASEARRNRARAARVRQRQLVEIGEGVNAQSCTGLLETDLARATDMMGTGLGAQMMEEHTEQMFTRMISMIISVFLQPMTENVMSRGGNIIINIIIDLLTLLLALPLCVALSHAFVHVLAYNMCMLITEALHYKLTASLNAKIESDVSPELTAMLGQARATPPRHATRRRPPPRGRATPADH